MAAGPPRPRPWPDNEPKTIGTDDVQQMTAPLAWQLYSGVIGYHAPKKLTDAQTILDGLRAAG